MLSDVLKHLDGHDALYDFTDAVVTVRLKSDTQYETRIVAEQISAEVKRLFPVAWETLIGEDYAKA